MNEKYFASITGATRAYDHIDHGYPQNGSFPVHYTGTLNSRYAVVLSAFGKEPDLLKGTLTSFLLLSPDPFLYSSLCGFLYPTVTWDG